MYGQTRPRRTRVYRDDIEDAIREVKINPGQQLRHVEVSRDIYDMAKNFARWAPNFGAESQSYRFKMDFLYQLLQNNINSRSLQEAPEEVEGWQSACKALLRYALNLLLAPKRPEFRRLKLSSSFYVSQVLRKLPKGAENILVFMGYKPTSNEMQELKYEGDVNIERVLETAADLVILHSELDLIKELVGTAIHQSQSDMRVANFVTLHRILDARARSDEKYDDTWKHLVRVAYSPPRDPRNQLQSGRPTFNITAYGNRQFLDAKQDVRKGSSPALNQWSDIQTAGLDQDLDLRRGSVPVLNSHPQSQFQMPRERLLEPVGRSHHSPSWSQVPQHAVPHQQYPSSGPHVLGALQSWDPSTASKLDPAIELQDLHALHRQAALSGSAAVPQSTQQCSSVGQKAQHHHNMPLGTATTSSGECRHVQSTHQSQSPSSDSSSHYQNVPYGVQVIELAQSSRGEDLRYRHNQSGLMSINTEIKDARSVIDDNGVGPCYDAHSPPDWSLAHTPSAQDQQDINDAWRIPTEDIYESASGAGSGGASLERDSSLPSPRNKPVETSGSASVKHESLTTAVTRQTVPRVVADCDEDMLPEPQPLKSSSSTLPHQGTIPEPDSKPKSVPKPRSRLQDMHTSRQSVQQDGVQKHMHSPRQPSRGASTLTESVLSDNATSDGEGVNIQEPVATGAVVGKESGETGLHLHKDGREHSIGHRSPTSPLQGKTLATVFEWNAMAHKPEQAPIKDRVTNESSLDFGGQRGPTLSGSHQKTTPSSRAYDMPSPQEMRVGQTELADPAVEGFWYCSYCTNMVSNTLHECDVCGGSSDAV